MKILGEWLYFEENTEQSLPQSWVKLSSIEYMNLWETPTYCELNLYGNNQHLGLVRLPKKDVLEVLRAVGVPSE